MARTLKDLAAEALAVQDACNLSGVAQSFARAMLDLRALGLDTEECNTNAITRVWLDKLTSLAGVQGENTAAMFAAFQGVARIAEGK